MYLHKIRVAFMSVEYIDSKVIVWTVSQYSPK